MLFWSQWNILNNVLCAISKSSIQQNSSWMSFGLVNHSQSVFPFFSPSRCDAPRIKRQQGVICRSVSSMVNKPCPFSSFSFFFLWNKLPAAAERAVPAKASSWTTGTRRGRNWVINMYQRMISSSSSAAELCILIRERLLNICFLISARVNKLTSTSQHLQLASSYSTVLIATWRMSGHDNSGRT